MHLVGRHLLGVALCLVRTVLDILMKVELNHVNHAVRTHLHDRSPDARRLHGTARNRSNR